jgi:hypothetical protein
VAKPCVSFCSRFLLFRYRSMHYFAIAFYYFATAPCIILLSLSIISLSLHTLFCYRFYYFTITLYMHHLLKLKRVKLLKLQYIITIQCLIVIDIKKGIECISKTYSIILFTNILLFFDHSLNI